MDNITTAQYKAYANDIVGIWYNDISDEILVFSFLYNFTQESDLLIVEKGKCTTTTYSIQIKLDENWYMTMCREKPYKITSYSIELLSPDVLVLKGLDGQMKTYIRKIDNAFVHDTLMKVL